MDTLSNWLTSSRHKKQDHAVAYYQDNTYLIKFLIDYFETSKNSNEHFILIAKPSTIKSLYSYSIKHDELKGFMDERKFSLYSADTLIADFIVDGHVNLNKFNKLFNDLISGCINKNHQIKIFGEMVAVLWENGLNEAAIELETIWHQLTSMYSIKLFCAYPEYLFKSDNNGQNKVNKYHDITARLGKY